MNTNICEGIYDLHIEHWGIVLSDSKGNEENVIPFSLCVRKDSTERYTKVDNYFDTQNAPCELTVDEVDTVNCDIYATVTEGQWESIVFGNALPPQRMPNRKDKIEPVSGKYWAECTPVCVKFVNDDFETFDTFRNPDKLFILTRSAGVVPFDKNVHHFEGWQKVDVVVKQDGTITIHLLEDEKNKDNQLLNRRFVCNFLFGTVDSRNMAVAEIVRKGIIPWEEHDDPNALCSNEKVIAAAKGYITKNVLTHYEYGCPGDEEKAVASILLGRGLAEYLWKLYDSYKLSNSDKVVFNKETGLFDVYRADGTSYRDEGMRLAPELFSI